MAEDFQDRPQKLVEAFRRLDTDRTGTIDMAMLQKLLSNYAPTFSAAERNELMTELQSFVAGDGKIMYEKFVRELLFAPPE